MPKKSLVLSGEKYLAHNHPLDESVLIFGLAKAARAIQWAQTRLVG